MELLNSCWLQKIDDFFLVSGKQTATETVAGCVLAFVACFVLAELEFFDRFEVQVKKLEQNYTQKESLLEIGAHQRLQNRSTTFFGSERKTNST